MSRDVVTLCLTCGENSASSECAPDEFATRHTDEACPAGEAVVAETDDENRVETDGRREDVVCPVCESQGFDGQGHTDVEGTQMYLRQCWNCGTAFAVESDGALRPDGGRDVADVSPGTELVAGTTGWIYVVLSVDDGTVLARGPNGPLRVDYRELQENIARGMVEVR